MPLSQIEILHQDAALLVINKPTLLLSVPGRAEDNKDCLVTRLQENGYPEARIVHRLDWETSGIIVLARDADSHRELSRQFHDRETEKAYTALCWGQPELDSGSIDLPLRYDPPTKPRHVVDHEHGKHALTFWQVTERCGDYCRVELTPITGSYRMQYASKDWKPQFTSATLEVSAGMANQLKYGGYGKDTAALIPESGKYVWSLQFSESGNPEKIMLSKCR